MGEVFSAFTDETPSLTNETLREAVAMWCADEAQARQKYGPIEEWNTRKVTDMQELFKRNYDFNGKIGGWNTSNVTDMEGMFWAASSFDQPLSFDTSKVTNMPHMFYEAEAFNRPLNFDTSKVNNMFCMFSKATSFTQPLNFDVSDATNMSYMFFMNSDSGPGAFNQPSTIERFEKNSASQSSSGSAVVSATI